jgi:hypothetical protein
MVKMEVKVVKIKVKKEGTVYQRIYKPVPLIKGNDNII